MTTVTLYVEVDGDATEEGMAVALVEHLLETWNDDDSIKVVQLVRPHRQVVLYRRPTESPRGDD